MRGTCSVCFFLFCWFSFWLMLFSLTNIDYLSDHNYYYYYYYNYIIVIVIHKATTS